MKYRTNMYPKAKAAVFAIITAVSATMLRAFIFSDTRAPGTFDQGDMRFFMLLLPVLIAVYLYNLHHKTIHKKEVNSSE